MTQVAEKLPPAGTDKSSFWKYIWRYGGLLLLAALAVMLAKLTLNWWPTEQKRVQELVRAYDLEDYEYILLIHVTPKDCYGCLQTLLQAQALQDELEAKQVSALVAISSTDTDAFWAVYNSLGLKLPFIKEKDFRRLNWEKENLTPYCYLYDLRRYHLIYSDVLPLEQAKFIALANLMKRYAGVLL